MQRIQRQIVLRAEDAKKRAAETDGPRGVVAHSPVKKTKVKSHKVQTIVPPQRGKQPSMRGKLIMGHKSILLNEDKQCVAYFENSVPPISKIKGRYVYQSGQHRLVAWERKRKHSLVVGTRGHCKAYIQTSPTEGVIIFHERNMVDRTNRVWQELVKRDLAPAGELRPMKLNFNILDCKKKWKKNFEGTTCIAVRHINFPTFLFDLQNDDHCSVLSGEKQFHTPDELVNSKYWCGAIDDLKAKYEFMYKKNIFEKHPKFTSEEYVRFCDGMTNLLGEEPDLKTARPSKMKWGNVLYCMDAKKWYWVDC